jgi:hypothetical protein
MTMTPRLGRRAKRIEELVRDNRETRAKTRLGKLGGNEVCIREQ